MAVVADRLVLTLRDSSEAGERTWQAALVRGAGETLPLRTEEVASLPSQRAGAAALRAAAGKD